MCVPCPRPLPFFSPAAYNVPMLSRPVLVTGAAGFLGSHLCEALLARGLPVVGLDNFDPYYDPRLKERNTQAVNATAERLGASFRLVTGDIRDAALLASLFAEPAPSAVFHLAARPGVLPSLRDPAACAEVNVLGTVAVLEAARRSGSPRVILASSSSVYGASPAAAFREDDPPAPLSPYGASKLAAEEYCRMFSALHGLPVVCLRLFTAYGPRQRPDLAIHKFTRMLLAGEPLPRFGDGESSRDYTYVDDIIRGFLAALEGEVVGETLNLGGGRPVTLNALIAALEAACGRAAIIEELPAPPGEMPRTQADATKAGRLLGWQPEVTLEEGLARFLAWWRAALP